MVCDECIRYRGRYYDFGVAGSDGVAVEVTGETEGWRVADVSLGGDVSFNFEALMNVSNFRP